MKSKIYLSILGLLGAAMTLTAQNTVSSALPLLDSPSDARTAALGGVPLAGSDRMLIYNNPGAMLFGDKRLSVDLSGELFEALPDTEGRMQQINAQIAARLYGRHTIMAGMRYSGGLSIQTITDEMEPRKRSIKPFDYTVDLGYAYRLGEHFGLFALGSYFSSYNGISAMSFAGSVGASYHTCFTAGKMAQQLDAMIKVTDLGMPLDYGKKGRVYALPSAVVGGASWGITPIKDWQASLHLGSRYTFLPSTAQHIVVGSGAEVGWKEIIALRGGYEYSNHARSYATLGAGISYGGIALDVAYRHGLGEHTPTTLMCGLRYAF